MGEKGGRCTARGSEEPRAVRHCFFLCSASGLCTASLPLLSLFTRYYGVVLRCHHVRPAASVS